MYAAKTAAAAAANVGGHDGQGKIWKTFRYQLSWYSRSRRLLYSIVC